MNWKKLVEKHPGQIKTPRFKWPASQPSAFHLPTKSSTIARIIPQHNAEIVK